MMRKAIAMAAVLASLALPLAARAEHCPTALGGANDVLVFSGTGGALNAGALGCLTQEEAANTDVITPGATQMFVRWLNAAAPVVGKSTLAFSGLTGCASPCTLTWTKVSTLGTTYYDSQVLDVDPLDTLVASATATVCLEVDLLGKCIDSVAHTYRPASEPMP